LYYDANTTFRILVKIIQGYATGAGHLRGAGAQSKNQKETELSSKVRSGTRTMAI